MQRKHSPDQQPTSEGKNTVLVWPVPLWGLNSTVNDQRPGISFTVYRPQLDSKDLHRAEAEFSAISNFKLLKPDKKGHMAA
ncbi:hypothetical protein N7465_010470 [Penicillium sp. CMV-2018d]|nr:hypothetical protein N7465_010470 [Penicillium sp. CMV-2018d]